MSRDRPQREAEQQADRFTLGVTFGERKSLSEALREIAEESRRRALGAQRRAGVASPIKTGFKPAARLDPAVNAALNRLWRLGRDDENLRRLYCMIGRGHAALSEADVLQLVKLRDEAIRKLAAWIVSGRGLKEAIQKTFLRGEQAPPVVTEEPTK